MTPTYLSQIDISNFRSFGPNFSLDIPAKPGLVIIYGMNGLGKTSFFEAIEWLLTADARRISDSLRAGQLEKYLTRRKADEMSHQVAIKFGDDEQRFARTATTGPSPTELADFLTNPSWNSKPSDTTPYFRLTMFLPQSKRFRFEEEKPAEQWRLLEGPAGVERLRQMLQALGSVKTKNAFNRVIRDLEIEFEKRQAELKEWQELLHRRDELKLQVSSGRVIEPTEAEKVLLEVREALIQVEEVAKQIDALNSEEKETGREISAIVRSFDEALERHREQLQKLKDASKIVAEWDTLASHRKTLEAKIKQDLDKLESGKPELEALQARQRQLASSKTDSESAHSKLGLQIASARNRASAAAIIAVATQKIVELEKESLEAQQRLKKSEADLKSVEKTIEERRTIASQIAGIDEELSALRSLQSKCIEYEASSKDAEANEAELELLQAEQVSVTQQAERAESQITELKQQEKKIVEDKEFAIASAETVHKALANMCDHIGQEATTCPICRAKYKSGELFSLAQKSLSEAGVDTVSLDTSLAAVRKELSELQISIAELNKRLALLPSLIARLVKRRTNRDAAKKEIENLAISHAFSNDDIPISANNAVDAAEQSRLGLSSKLQALPSSEKLTTSKNSLEASIASDESRIAANHFSIDDQKSVTSEHQSIVEAVEKDLASLKPIDQTWEDFADQLSIQQKLLSEEIAAIDIEVNSAIDAAGVKEHSQTSVQQTVDNAQRDLKAAEARQTVLSDRWIRIAGEEYPELHILARLVVQKEDEIELIESNRRKCEQLGAGVDTWNADTKSRDIASKVTAECAKRDNCTEDAVSSSLAESIADSEAKLTTARDAYAKAKELAEGLKEKADAFNDQALKPLTSRIQRFHDVLSPFRYQIEWAAKTAPSGGTKLTQSVSYSSGGLHREAPPMAELSDGQISVQGLATLLAASTEYRWSRWPALLLDDPLQSSDLLHASAFIDIIRGLISDLGYQIFLSSHDMEEAKYIIRKCERSDITVTQCHLLGPGVNGVRWTCETA